MSMIFLKYEMKGIFRGHPPILEDLGTSKIRLEKSQMERLGITQGDFVRVTGSRSTGAICHEIKDDFKLENDSEIICIPESSKLPQARLSDLIWTNVGNRGDGTTQVQIEKIPQNIAQKVRIVNRMDMSKKFDAYRLTGLVVCTNDMFRFSDPDPEKNINLFVEQVIPNEYSQITKDTQIEVSDESKPFPVNHPKLKNIKKVIPIAKQINTDLIQIIIPSIEIFDDGLRFNIYVNGKINQEEFANGHVSINVKMTDDLGHNYEIIPISQSGSSSHDGFEFHWTALDNPINQNAKNITITISELVIQAHFSPPRPMKPSNITAYNYSKIGKFPSFMIISGPWVVTADID